MPSEAKFTPRPLQPIFTKFQHVAPLYPNGGPWMAKVNQNLVRLVLVLKSARALVSMDRTNTNGRPEGDLKQGILCCIFFRPSH